MRFLNKKIALALVIIVIITTIFIYLSYLCHKDFEKAAVARTQEELLTIAKSTAARIEEFVETLEREAKILANEPMVQQEIKERIQQTKKHICPIKIFYMAHKDKVDALTSLDAKGIMLHRHPLWKDNKQRLNWDHSNKPGVAYVMREHKPYVSEVFQNNLGQPAISITEPVFDKEKFIGMVRWMLTIDTISKRFILPVKVGKNGFLWLLDERGTLVVHPDADRVNIHILTPGKKQFPDYDWSELENIIRKSTMGQEGVSTYVCPTCGRRIIAYVPVHLGNRVWSIGVSLNYSEIAKPILDHAIHHVEITALIMVLLIAGGLLFYRMERRRRLDLIDKNKELEQKIIERRRAEEALSESEGKLTGIVDSVTDLMIMIDNHFNVVWTNDVVKDLFGGDMVGRKCHHIYHGRDTVCRSCIVEQCFKDGRIHEFETEILKPDGNIMNFWCTASVAARHEDGRPKMVVEFLRDITERKQAEEEIRKSLREKDVLLREIHHRVKNNMQVISSLLKLQSEYIKDTYDVEMFKESQNRIKSMALVHEKLYQSKGLANIDFKEYIMHLTDMLIRSYGMNTGEITLSIDVENVTLDVDTAIPCGLIINELVSNSLKHAFSGIKKGTINISLHEINENEMELTVGDNGVGMLEELDYTNVDSLGLKLVNILTKQIGGSLTMDGKKGTVFHLRFSKSSEAVQLC